MHLLMLRWAKCRNETPCFNHVGGSFGNTKLEFNWIIRTCSFLRLVFADVDYFDGMIVDLSG